MISGADRAHSKRNGKYRDVLNSLVGVAISESSLSRFHSDAEQEQSHVNEPDEEEEEFQFFVGSGHQLL
jgi:hypothetical protein